MRKISHQILPPMLILSLALTGCAGQAKRPVTPPTKADASRTDAQTNQAVFENRQVKTFEPIRVQTGRYSVVTAKPSAEQVNPLLIVIDVRLPRDILTVKDAADYCSVPDIGWPVLMSTVRLPKCCSTRPFPMCSGTLGR